LRAEAFLALKSRALFKSSEAKFLRDVTKKIGAHLSINAASIWTSGNTNAQEALGHATHLAIEALTWKRNKRT